MKLVQSNEMSRVFKTEHKGLNITLNIRKGGSSIKCFITINDMVVGKYDISSRPALKMAYNAFKDKFEKPDKYFKDEAEFCDLFLRVSDKLMNEDYEREGKQKIRELTNEARDFLKNKYLLDKMDYIERRTTEDPLVACWEDLLVFNLVIVSCKTTKPITLEFTGPAGSGKTYPANHAVNGFPDEMIIAPTGDTKNAAKYDWDHYDNKAGEYINVTRNKCIYFREKQDSIEAVKFFKPMMSHDNERLVYRVPIRDPVSGEYKTNKFIMDGIASFILLSVQHMDDEEMSTRTMKSSPKTSKRKTNNVITKTFESDGLHRVWKRMPELDIMHDAMFNLQRYKTINIFSSILSKIFPKDDMKRSRDMNRLRGLIRSSSVLHQFQRCTEIIDGNDVLYSSLEDNLIALLIMDGMFESTVLGIPSLSLKIYGIMKNMDDNDVELTPNNIHEWCEVENIRQTMRTLKEVHLDTLENHRMIKVKKFGTKGHEREYSINKRYEDITKVSKLTPIFISELQKSYPLILETYSGFFPDLKIPEVDSPDVYPKLCDDDLVTGEVIKHIFGFNYFSDKAEHTVFRKITPKNLYNVLFGGAHIIDEESVVDKDRQQTQKNKEKAKREIKSGASAKEWKHISESDADKAYLKHVEEEEEKIREFMGI